MLLCVVEDRVRKTFVELNEEGAMGVYLLGLSDLAVSLGRNSHSHE